MSELTKLVIDLAKKIKKHPASLSMWFDDAGGIKIGEEYIVVKVDGFSESRAKYPWCSYRDFGFKAVAAALSDVFSKGCRPYIYAVSLGVKPNDVDVVEEIINGVEDAINFYGGYLENVDTNVGNDVWIDVFILATCRYLPLQRKAKPGNIIVIPRTVGLSYVAYLEYLKNKKFVQNDVKNFSCRSFVDLRIVDCIENIRLGLVGSIDISDTLYETIEIISNINDVGIYIDTNIDYLLHPLAIDYARNENLNKIEVVMKSNEEYIPMLIIEASYLDTVLETLINTGFQPKILGTIINTKILSFRGTLLKKIMWNYSLGRII